MAVKNLPGAFSHVMQNTFDGASNVRKDGEIMKKHCPKASVEHSAIHVVSLIVKKFDGLPAFRHFSNFAKIVHHFVVILHQFYDKSFELIILCITLALNHVWISQTWPKNSVQTTREVSQQHEEY